MRFYKNQHQFYIGIDLHARTMYVCVINNLGETVFHKNMICSTENLELVTNTFGKDIVIGVECIFTWYWIADFCAENGIDFALTALFIVILLEQLKSAGGKAEPAVIAAVSSLICLLVFGPSNFILPSLMITVFLLTLLRNKLSPREADQNE